MRRTAGAFAVLVGLGLIAAILLLSLPAEARRGSDVLEDASPSVAGPGLRALRAGLDDLGPGIEALRTAIPATAAARGETQDALLGRYPATRVALARFEEIGGDASAIVANLERNEADFRRADRIRTGSVPLAVLPWCLVALGVALVALGMAIILGWRQGWILLAVLGASMAVVPVALDAPGQIQSAADVLDSLKVGPDIPPRTRERFTVVERAAEELPDLVAEIEASGYASPALRTMVDGLPETLVNFGAGVSFREAHGKDVAALKDLPVRSLAWAFPALGVVLVAAGLLALAGRDCI